MGDHFIVTRGSIKQHIYILVALVFLTGCDSFVGKQKVNQNLAESPDVVLQPLDPFDSAKVQIDLNTVAEAQARFAEINSDLNLNNKAQMRALGVVGLASAAKSKSGKDIELPKGTKLAVLVKNGCTPKDDRDDDRRKATVYSKGGSSDEPLSVLAKKYEEVLELKTQAYNLSLKEDTKLKEIKEEAYDDNCVLGVSHNNTASIPTLNHKQISLQNSLISDDPLSQRFHGGVMNNYEAYAKLFSGADRINADVVVAVLDTGVQYNHEDFRNDIVARNGGDRLKEDFASSVFSGNSNKGRDDNGHGTHVAGIIAADFDNGRGTFGVAPFVKIMPLKVLGTNGSGSVTGIINGINYAVTNGADVINMSLGGPGTNSMIESAIRTAVQSGVFVAVSAGNSSNNLDSEPSFPAVYGASINGMMTVGSIDSVTGSRSNFSNYSTTRVEIAAPGSNGICTTIIEATEVNDTDDYACLAGTSMSSPMVAAAAASAIGFMKTHGHSYTPASIEEF